MPCVSSQPSDMGFCTGREVRGFSSKGSCSRSFWLHCWYCWASFVLGRGGKLPWQAKLKKCLVWCFGHKSESEPVGWALNYGLPDAVSVSSSCWYPLGGLGIHIHIPMVFCPTWYFCLFTTFCSFAANPDIPNPSSVAQLEHFKDFWARHNYAIASRIKELIRIYYSLCNALLIDSLKIVPHTTAKISFLKPS